MDLISARSLFAPELQNPAIRSRLFGMTHAEVGGQGPEAQQAFLETIFNRAAARNQPLAQTLSGSYFPAVTYNRAVRGVNDSQRGRYEELLGQVLGGSNVGNYATGNASGTVGFAGGPQTAAYGGERFGVEGPDRSWAQQMGFGGQPMAYAGGSPGGLPQQASEGPGDLPFNAQPTSGTLPQGNRTMPGILGNGPQGGGLLSMLPGVGGYLGDRRNAIRAALSGGDINVGGQLDQQQMNNQALSQYIAQAPDIPQQLRPILAANPQLAQAFITQNFVKPQTTDDIKEFELAKKDGYKGSFVEFKQAQRAPPQDRSIPTQVAQREAEAKRLGIAPDNPAYNAYVLSGTFPKEGQKDLSATDKKFISESTDLANTATNTVSALQDAMKLSPKAYGGMTAAPRAFLGNQLPDALVPDKLASPQGAQDTEVFRNLVMTTALPQLKAIFGGNPTEGERKVLLDMQASLNQPDNVRQEVLKRAITLAQQRGEYHRNKADELRGGTFYKPGGGGSGGGAPAPATAKADPLGIR
jgi:hypothetical protein